VAENAFTEQEHVGELTDEQRQTLWEQFVEVHADEQKAFDNSVRTLAAAGIAVTVTLATALKAMPTIGQFAVGFFVGSLGLNLASHVTSQFDMRARVASLRKGLHEGYEGNRWTIATSGCNLAAGAAFIAASVLLAVFIGTSA
jgi:hypothetical protein